MSTGTPHQAISQSSDTGLKIEIRRVFEQNFRVDGVRNVWRQLKREGFDVTPLRYRQAYETMSLQGII